MDSAIGPAESPSVLIKLPNLFQSFLSAEPVIRSDYEQCRRESCDWFAERRQCDEKASQKFEGILFTWFAAAYISDTDYDRFRIVSDWSTLACYIDDMFDNGPLTNDSVRAQAFVVSSIRTEGMRDIH